MLRQSVLSVHTPAGNRRCFASAMASSSIAATMCLRVGASGPRFHTGAVRFNFAAALPPRCLWSPVTGSMAACRTSVTGGRQFSTKCVMEFSHTEPHMFCPTQRTLIVRSSGMLCGRCFSASCLPGAFMRSNLPSRAKVARWFPPASPRPLLIRHLMPPSLWAMSAKPQLSSGPAARSVHVFLSPSFSAARGVQCWHAFCNNIAVYINCNSQIASCAGMSLGRPCAFQSLLWSVFLAFCCGCTPRYAHSSFVARAF